jgi:hypothetical protein
MNQEPAEFEELCDRASEPRAISKMEIAADQVCELEGMDNFKFAKRTHQWVFCPDSHRQVVGTRRPAADPCAKSA